MQDLQLDKDGNRIGLNLFDDVEVVDTIDTVEVVEIVPTIDTTIEDIITKELEVYNRLGADDYAMYLVFDTSYSDDIKEAIKQAIEVQYKKDNTPTKGVITKDIWDVPIPSNKDILTNKNVDMIHLGAVLLDSNYGGSNNMNSRYIYKAKLWNNKLEVTNEDGTTEVIDLYEGKDKLPVIAHKLGMSLATFRRRLKALLDTKLGLFEVGINADGEVFYKINYAKDNKYYVTIPSDVLEYLITVCNSNMIKFYILFKYNLTKVIKDDKGNFVRTENIRKQMTYDYLLENIGYSAKLNRKKVAIMIDGLISLGLIKHYEIDTPIQTIDKKTNKIKTLTVKGYEYELVDYDVWRNNRPIKSK